MNLNLKHDCCCCGDEHCDRKFSLSKEDGDIFSRLLDENDDPERTALLVDREHASPDRTILLDRGKGWIIILTPLPDMFLPPDFVRKTRKRDPSYVRQT